MVRNREIKSLALYMYRDKSSNVDVKRTEMLRTQVRGVAEISGCPIRPGTFRRS